MLSNKFIMCSYSLFKFFVCMRKAFVLVKELRRVTLYYFPFLRGGFDKALCIFLARLKSLNLFLLQSCNLFAMLPRAKFAYFRCWFIHSVTMEFIVEPCRADGASISVVMNSVADFFIFVPESFVFTAISPFHDPKTVNLIVCIISFVIFSVFGPIVEAKSIYMVILPFSLILSTIFPFLWSESGLCAIHKVSLEVITLNIFLLAKSMFLIELEVSDEEVTSFIDQLASAIGASENELALIFDTIFTWKLSMAMCLSKLPLTWEWCPISKHHWTLPVSESSDPLTTVSGLGLFIFIDSSFELIKFI